METVKLFFKEAWVLISSISWRDFIDIALVTIILFYAFRFIRDRRAGKLIVGVVLLVAVQVLSEICGLGTINFLLGNFFEVGVLAIIILFQPELRSALEKVGSEPLRSLKMIGEKNSAQKRNQLVDSVCEACCQMAKEKTGALIVFERKTKLGEHINSGTVINADPSAPMIENVFFYIFCVVFGSKIFVRATIILIKTASHLCMPHSLTQIPALSAFLTLCHKMVTFLLRVF